MGPFDCNPSPRAIPAQAAAPMSRRPSTPIWQIARRMTYRRPVIRP